MSAALGELIVRLSAETSSFTSALTKAEYQMRQSMDRMSSAVGVLEKAFGALFGIAAGVGFAEMIKSAIEAEAELGRVGARAGLTGEQMSSLSHAALLSHTELDDVAGFSAKLSKALLLGVDAGSKQAAVLRALGITGADTAKLLADPANALLVLSKRLDMLPEGGTKAAAQLLLVGKGGGTVSAMMNELAKQTELVATRTNAEIAAAKAFEDRLVEMRIMSSNLRTTLANALLPTLGDVVDAFIKAGTGAGSAKEKLDAFAADGAIREWAKDAVIALGTVAEALVLIGRVAYAVTGSFRVVAAEVDLAIARTNAPKFKLTGALGFSKDEADKANADFDAALKKRNAILGSANQNYEDLWNKNGAFITDALKKQFAITDAAAKAQADFPQNADANDLRNVAAIDKAAKAMAAAKAANEKRVENALRVSPSGKDDPAKALLERQIKELENYAATEKLILQARDEYLKVYYAQGYLSEKQYYDTRMQVMLDDLNVERDANVKKIALIDAYIGTLAKKKGAEKLIEEQLKQRGDIEQKIIKLEIEASKSVGLFNLESQAAAPQYLFSLHAINAELLALQGHTAAAAAIIRTDSEVLQRRKLATSGDTGALAQLDQRDRLLAIDDKLTEAAVKYGYAVQQVGINQSLIDLQFAAGSITELESYAKKADAARAMIPLLNAQAASYEAIGNAIAKAGGDPTKFLLAAQQMRLEIAKLAVDADALAKKFTDIFEGSFATFLTDIVGRTKTVKQAFLDMAKSIEQSISQIAAKNVAEQIFGKSGPLGGLGTLFAKGFGDKGAGAAGADAAIARMSASASAATLAIDADVKSYLAVALAADGAATALASVAASSGAASILGPGKSGLDSLFGPGGLLNIIGLAEGTPYVQRDMLAVVHRGEAIIPAAQNKPGAVSKGGNVVTIHVNVPAGTSGASANQIALETGRHVQRALAKLG